MDENAVYQFGPFSLDADERCLRRNGNVVPVSAKVFDTMLVLVRRNGCLVRKGELFRTVWPDSMVDDNSIAHNVAEVRRILRTGGQGYQLETVRGHGYRLRPLSREEVTALPSLGRAPRECSGHDWQNAVAADMPADKAQALFEDARVQKFLESIRNGFDTTCFSLPDYKSTAAKMASIGFGPNARTVYEVDITCSGDFTSISLRAEFAAGVGPVYVIVFLSFGGGTAASKCWPSCDESDITGNGSFASG